MKLFLCRSNCVTESWPTALPTQLTIQGSATAPAPMTLWSSMWVSAGKMATTVRSTQAFAPWAIAGGTILLLFHFRVMVKRIHGALTSCSLSILLSITLFDPAARKFVRCVHIDSLAGYALVFEAFT